MEFKQLSERANEINNKLPSWGLAEITQGFVGDVGDLVKLIMAKNGVRHYKDVDEKLAHELADCLWSLLVIANMTGIDLEKAFLNTMNKIEKKTKN